jgi:PII-like signaling protein
MEEVLELTAYVGERDRSEGRLLADALMEAYERHSVRMSVLLRGLEGFGIKQRLQTERLLTLSEDLPIVAIAVDSPARIHRLAEDVQRLALRGLITLERARVLDGSGLDLASLPQQELKLTIQVGRQQRVGRSPAYVAIVACLHRHGLSGASVLLGLDGSTDGVRHRASFLARNAEVPLMIVSVGESRSIAQALPELYSLLSGASVMVERVQVCKRDGVLLGAPVEAPSSHEMGLACWQKLTIYASEHSRHGHESLHGALIRRLRGEGAAGATAVRGLWGYHGDHAPHGERFFSLARHVPTLTVLLDTPPNMRRWFAIVDEVTAETGLVTSEVVPALRAAGPELVHGGLTLVPAPQGAPPGNGAPAL